MVSNCFVSNFFNHHQQPLSDAFFSKLGDGYLFIETEEMSYERKNMKWGIAAYPPYVITCQMFHDNKKMYTDLIDQADVVIYGSAPNGLFRQRLKSNRVTFRYSERPLKKGLQLWKYPFRFLKWHLNYSEKQKHYLLCASAYAAKDFSKFLMFRGKCYKWGYFPKTYRYDNLDRLIQSKTKNTIIWVARFLELKHPEIAVEIGKRLRQNGYSFENGSAE